MADFHPIVQQTPPSPDQAPAVTTTDRDVVLVAGAGAGKTRTLVARILHLLATGAPMRGIIAVTFTLKAAREMRNRLRQEITRYLADPTLDADERTRWQTIYANLDAARISTIHGLCSEILRSHPAEAAIDPDFTVLEEATMLQLRGEAVAEALAWAAEDATATTLFTHFTAATLANLLEALLADRLKAAAIFAARPWERWMTTTVATLTAALANDELTDAAAPLLDWDAAGVTARALAAGDALAAALVDFGDAWRTAHRSLAEGDLPQTFAALARLGKATPGNKGKAALYGGVDPKPLTKRFSSAFKSQVLPLIDGVDPALDATLVTLMPLLAQLFAVALAAYRTRLEVRHALDFDDLEARALDLLRTDATVRARWQAETYALLVDEFQDTNSRQRDLVRLLNGERGRLFIVGDAKQSIYRFRGAEVEVFRQERAAIEAQGRRCDMHTSYRTHAALLDALNALLATAMDGGDASDALWREPFAPLTAARPTDANLLPAPHVEFHLGAGSKSDGSLARAADGLLQRLRTLVTADETAPRWGDVAILCRTSRSFIAYEDACERAGIPYETVAGRGFLERPEVRDLLNALQALTDPTDDLALYGLLRSPAIGLPDPLLHRLRLGDSATPGALWHALCATEDPACCAAATLIEALHQLAGRVPVADLLKHFVDHTGYRAILLAADDTRGARNVSKLLLDAQRSGLVSTGAFLEYVRGLRKAGSRESEARADSHGAVQIMTVHQAKGLEFPIVVIGDAASTGGGRHSELLLDNELGVVVKLASDVGAPFVWKLAQQREASKEVAESDRLLYVATTRARDRLLVSGHISGVNQDGSLRLNGWLKVLCHAVGLERLPDNFEADGAAPHQLYLPLAGVPVVCGGALYPTEFLGDLSCVASSAEAATPADNVEPILLAPAPPSAAPLDETPPRVWRVATTRRWAPGWVVGKLVHAAIAAWRFPDAPEFDGWCRAQARSYGLDVVQIDHAQQRTRRLLNNFRRHPLYAEIANAEARRHEIPYVLPEGVDSAASFGQIDLLYRAGGRWTLVDFKSDRLRDERARDALLADGDYQAQIERYLTAVEGFLGERPRGLLCLLDDRSACSVVELGAEPAPLPAPSLDDALDDGWTQVYELADPACTPLLDACRERGLPAPEVGYDIPDARGRVLATAELAWPAVQTAAFLPGQERDLLLAGQAGWRTVMVETAEPLSLDLSLFA
ncbi:MAG TPA: UvrD-helicase domain-containing protein [Chloroflexi bacterium]|nr:UvrD-helicase domain-containing protein [Chloroflexota bacterium]